MDSAEMDVINWAAAKTFDEKKVFLKAYFDALSPEEMTWARNIAQRYKRGNDRRKKRSNVQTPDPAPVQPLLSFVSPSGEVMQGWWSAFKTSEVLSIDCEMVAIPSSQNKGRYVQTAATVSVCNYLGKEVYKATVKHAKDSLLVTKESKRINGIEADSLINGKEIAEVRSELEELFDQKLIMGHALAGDFHCLGMESGYYDIFDLQWHWWWLDEDGSTKPFKLEALFKHFFPDEEFQLGVHDAFQDAKAVMKIFRFKYLKGEKKEDFMTKFCSKAVSDGQIDRLLVQKRKKKVNEIAFRIG